MLLLSLKQNSPSSWRGRRGSGRSTTGKLGETLLSSWWITSVRDLILWPLVQTSRRRDQILKAAATPNKSEQLTIIGVLTLDYHVCTERNRWMVHFLSSPSAARPPKSFLPSLSFSLQGSSLLNSSSTPASPPQLSLSNLSPSLSLPPSATPGAALQDEMEETDVPVFSLVLLVYVFSPTGQ